MPEATFAATSEASPFRVAGSLQDKIEQARLELLDLSTRNRLLHTPRSGRAKIVEVADELAKAIYQTLVIDGKRFTFAPGRADPAESAPPPDAPLAGLEGDQGEAPDPELVDQPEIELDERGRVATHWDGHLQTRMTSAGLQKRLLDLYIDSKTLEEEQGVNVLFLAVGFLKWRAPTTPNDDRFAPLVLVPVRLERSNAGEKFHLRWSGDDIESNLSLQLYLHRQFGMKLPEIGDFEALDVDSYFAQVGELVRERPNWGVVADHAVLGLFSFAKFMMYRDLDPEQWQAFGGFESIPTLRGVVSDGFPGASLSNDEVNIDSIISPKQMMHVVDCDSSQSLVVYDVQAGNSILVQGPPGTGKSQTIANIIATAIADKKRVLFVAEKMAALEVVKRRLDNIGIGDACLELHSNKANKRILLEELRRTWELGRPAVQDGHPVVEQLTDARDELNAHAERLHRELGNTGLTPYQVFGHLVRLRREGHTTRQVKLDRPTKWAPHEVTSREDLLRDLTARIEGMGLPSQHPWTGVGVRGMTPNDRTRVLQSVAALSEELGAWRDSAEHVMAELDLPAPEHFDDIGRAISRAEALMGTPPIGREVLVAPIWGQLGAVDELIEHLGVAQDQRSQALEVADPSALDGDWKENRDTLEGLAPSFKLADEVARLAALQPILDRLLPDATRLAQLLGEREKLTLDSVIRLTALGERASTVPEIGRDALIASIWDRGVDTIEELIESVEQVQRAKASLFGVFRDAAWDQELDDARAHLAALSGSWLRFFNGKWRQANRQVRAQLVSPKMPADEVLSRLDELTSAQAAQRKIAFRDREGAEAFGSGWQRERSETTFLMAVASWMRSLRPLGTGVRERLADVADRSLATELAKRVRPLIDELKADLLPLSELLITAGHRPWGEETIAKRVPLTEVQTKAATWGAASGQCALLLGRAELDVQGALDHVSRITRAQKALRQFELSQSQGLGAFGPLWRGIDTDIKTVNATAAWMRENDDLRVLAATVENPENWRDEAKGLEEAGKQLARSLAGVFDSLHFEGNREVPARPADASLAGLATLFERWRANPEGLPQWVAYVGRAKQAEEKSLPDLVSRLATGEVPAAEAIGTFQLAYYEAVLAAMTERDPELSRFDGDQHSQTVERFAQFDWKRMQLARHQVLAAHHAKIPQRGGATGPTAVLMGEMVKRRKHMPIRELMGRCAPVIQALKPVFMMSPLSVAQFLPPGALDFDMLVVDEASQVQPVDALGSVARAKQLVIVGDEKQLPPTRFFAKVLGDDEGKEEDGASAADIESVLGLCRARGLPERMLRWHYRSRHESLIAVSNSQFYENKLVIVPSPYTSEAGIGLRFNHLPNAVYDRGNTRTNPEEARVVALAVIEHASQTPKLSLGVATFSAQQRRAIIDQLELLRRQHPETEGFFSGPAEEPFFVKSLENIQGDERDVIFISVGYGRDIHRHMTMNFGPLNKDGGERRLNVLISRAKSRCEIFSSITDDDIDVERAKGRGTAAFKLFLHYARTGNLMIARETSSQRQGVFKEEVAAALRSRGIDVHTDVGIAGLFVDIAIADSKRPGRYVLGVECDGEWYRDARSARDRDRLREAALRDKGWTMYRIWSADWFQRPQAELEKLLEAIENAIEHSEDDGISSPARRAVPIDIYAVERGEFVEVGLTEAGDEPDAVFYEEALIKVPRSRYELHMVPADAMADIVRDIVEVEGPVHRDEVVARVRTLWGLQRAGGRIQAAVDAGIATALGRRLIERSHSFFLSLLNQEVKVRDRTEVASLTLRRPDYLPPQEIDRAIVTIVQKNLGATVEELVLHVSRQLGYRSTSGQLRALIEDRVGGLLEDGSLAASKDFVTLADGSGARSGA
ncbi:DUF3320 domain-containing protein [Luteimonas salinilitoris]|uniref:DUF3320 domain-containing protein n=1 Tax=Luteimonas salinilitoris TaxID=3237697 RepID=A0ABV4HTZ2_9GAMM